MKDSKVYVMAQVDGDDIVFRASTAKDGLSPLFRLTGEASGGRGTKGNPYLIYGDTLADWLQKNKFAMSIVVATMTSGSLL